MIYFFSVSFQDVTTKCDRVQTKNFKRYLPVFERCQSRIEQYHYVSTDFRVSNTLYEINKLYANDLARGHSDVVDSEVCPMEITEDIASV